MRAKAAWGVVGLLCATARADGGPLVTSYAEGQQRAALRMGAQLEETLERLPGVADARVHIAPSELARAPLDEPAPAPRVSAWLSVRGPGPGDAAVRGLLRAAWPGVSDDSITVVRTASASPRPPPPRRLCEVGPFRVDARSAPHLRGLLALLLGSNALLAALLLATGTGARWPRAK